MQANKTQYGRALAIIPSETVPIPNIATEVVRATTTDESTNRLICDTVNFIDLNVNQMSILYNLTQLTSTFVVSVLNENELNLADDIMATGDEFVIYNEADIAGCALYIPVKEVPANVTVKTVGGDVVTFYRLLVGNTILPVNVSMVMSATGIQNDQQILGLW
tara:strand:+ start:10471 stop:10959 length:489 start_codon:yes stop_codon:yes gene_type:complete